MALGMIAGAGFRKLRILGNAAKGVLDRVDTSLWYGPVSAGVAFTEFEETRMLEDLESNKGWKSEHDGLLIVLKELEGDLVKGLVI